MCVYYLIGSRPRCTCSLQGFVLCPPSNLCLVLIFTHLPVSLEIHPNIFLYKSFGCVTFLRSQVTTLTFSFTTCLGHETRFVRTPVSKDCPSTVRSGLTMLLPCSEWIDSSRHTNKWACHATYTKKSDEIMYACLQRSCNCGELRWKQCADSRKFKSGCLIESFKRFGFWGQELLQWRTLGLRVKWRMP